MRIARQRQLTTQSRQKSYSDKRQRDLTFSIGVHVFLKISPTRGVMRIGPVAYRLALPPDVAEVHNIFHLFQLHKYIHDPTHIVNYPPLELREDLSYDAFPRKIVDQQEKKLRNRSIPYVKVLWTNHSDREATWVLESTMWEQHPHLFKDPN